MHTLIRDQDISKHDFVFYSDRLIRLVLFFACTLKCVCATCICPLDFIELHSQVVEHGLGHLPFTEKQVVTPTGDLINEIVLLRNFTCCDAFS